MIPDDLAERLLAVRGVVAVALGGSRARGTHRPDSDWDLGLYYRGELDVDHLRAIAASVADSPVELTVPGGWGPWVNGGGWLRIGGAAVDWLYRDLDRVTEVWGDCQAGRYEVGVQAGHPLGFYSHAYPGEVALCQVLADPAGELAALRTETRHYPAALSAALVGAAWEAGFLVANAGKAVGVVDSCYAAGCLFRAVGVLAHALHGRAGKWLINEKGMIAGTGLLPGAPAGFTDRAQRLLAATGGRPDELEATLDAADRLVGDVLEVLS
jgi:hypothetical protein